LFSHSYASISRKSRLLTIRQLSVPGKDVWHDVFQAFMASLSFHCRTHKHCIYACWIFVCFVSTIVWSIVYLHMVQTAILVIIYFIVIKLNNGCWCNFEIN
jgi:apolipoprotein N-acyltransferase